jgi:hypothetical protein
LLLQWDMMISATRPVTLLTLVIVASAFPVTAQGQPGGSQSIPAVVVIGSPISERHDSLGQPTAMLPTDQAARGFDRSRRASRSRSGPAIRGSRIAYSLSEPSILLRWRSNVPSGR